MVQPELLSGAMNDDSLTEKLMMVFLHYLGCKAPL
jgi:hypothetical protein